MCTILNHNNEYINEWCIQIGCQKLDDDGKNGKNSGDLVETTNYLEKIGDLFEIFWAMTNLNRWTVKFDVFGKKKNGRILAGVPNLVALFLPLS